MLHTLAHLALLPQYDVVIPSFRRGHVVADAVRSVVAQTHRAERIVLVDDGSADESANMIETLGREYPNVVPLLLPRNEGASAARNAGLAVCRSEWIAFLDSDDLWIEDAAATLLGAAARNALDVVVGLFSRIGLEGVAGTPECCWDGSDITAALRTGGVVGASWSILRRDVVLAVGGWDTSFQTCEDWDFFVRVAASGATFGRVERLVAFYRTVSGERLMNNDADLAAGRDRVLAQPALSQPGLRAKLGRIVCRETN